MVGEVQRVESRNAPTFSKSGLTKAEHWSGSLGSLLKIWRSGPQPRPVKQEPLRTGT